MSENEDKLGWNGYNSGKALAEARPRLIETLEKFTKVPGQAADLGCGSGRDTHELLKRGWRVDAVDSDLSSLEELKRHNAEPTKINILASSFESLKLAPNTYDLINASYSLPFCKPEEFEKFWTMLLASLKPGGVISCDLFGPNDAWAKLPRPAQTMTFLSLQKVRSLTENLKVEILKEEEYEGPTFAGPLKHWHIITCIARK